MLQQYANLQQQQSMPSVRIPPPAHDGGGLYNPFNTASSGPAFGFPGGAGTAGSSGFSAPPALRNYSQQWQV